MRVLKLILVACFVTLSWPVAAQEVTDRGREALTWLNGFREQNGRAPLRLSGELAKAAGGHAADMARRGFFSHTGSDGSGIGERARRADYRFCFIAENIAKGSRDVTGVLQGWAGSPGHRKNMLARDADEVALVEGPGHIWVMVLGRDGC